MLRASLIAALALSTVAPTSAAAEDCMCFGPDTVVRSLYVAQSQDLGPFFSSDGTLLSSSILLSARAADEAKQRDVPTEILWCWSANDPRCAPADPPEDHNPRAFQSARAFAVVEDDLEWPTSEGSTRSSRREGRDGDRSGVRSRVERPPRA